MGLTEAWRHQGFLEGPQKVEVPQRRHIPLRVSLPAVARVEAFHVLGCHVHGLGFRQL